MGAWTDVAHCGGNRKMTSRVGHGLTYALIALCWIWLQISVAHAGRDVTGVVVDQGSATPVAHAMVTVGGVEATTNAAGEFTVHNVPAGLLDLLVLADNYQPYFSQTRAGATLTVKLNAEGGGEIITVRAQAPREPNTHAVSVDQIRSMPGSGNDVLRVLQSLPGVARTPLGLGGLALRGTAPRDSRVFLDDIEVPLLYHFGGISSFVPSAAIAGLPTQLAVHVAWQQGEIERRGRKHSVNVGTPGSDQPTATHRPGAFGNCSGVQ